MSGFPILSLMILLPIAAAALTLFLSDVGARWLALGTTLFELPAWTRDPGEPWLQCAQRELREETGFRAAEMTPLGEIWPAPGFTDERMALFLATGLTPDPLPMDIDEDIVVETWPLAELAAMAIDGRLEDAKSVVSVLRAVHHLSQ